MTDPDAHEQAATDLRAAVSERLGAVGHVLARPGLVSALSFGLLFFGLLVDLATEQDLVVAVLYDIPIAVSALAASRRLTGTVVLLALIANTVAAYENAANGGGFDTVVLFNRGFAAASFIIVGAMTLARVIAVDEGVELGEAQSSADREQRLRHFKNAVSDAAGGRQVLERAVTELRTLLAAEAVVITAVDDGRFVDPRYADRAARLAAVGEPAAWAIDVIPTDGARSATVRSERGLVTSGWWRRENAPALAVVVDQPRADKPSALLAEALDTLEPLLRLAQRSAAGNDRATGDV